ncbi:hypothetical protein MVEN_00114700 [Mycena venus]|uniref:Uncharacterized protein n=1 Tax=Mycena venus TaxID=2733690 RepID=A0A8H6Z908_9AGAR|nr:hypothetical protein MVEN_00114700 [Mycena venus]
MSTPSSSTGSPPTPPQGSSAPSGPPPTAAKRKFDEIVASMPHTHSTVSQNKRTKRESMETKSPIDKLLSMARYFPRAVSPDLDIGLVLFYGALAHWGQTDSQDACNETRLPEKERLEQQKHAKAFDKMLSISPSSLEILHEFHKSDDQWPRLVSMFREAASSARQNDTSTLKQKHSYVLHDPTHSLVPKIPESALKSDRGLNHPMLRDAIIPWPLRLRIHEKQGLPEDAPEGTEPSPTPEATAALKALMKGKTVDKKPALVAKQYEYPSCFYAEGAFDPADPEKGLFRSQFILRVLRHIWTAPASAMNGASKIPKVCNARAHGQYKVIPEMLAYACRQARTTISVSDWTPKEGSYNYETMFNNIVLLFEADPTDPWAIETLEWLQNGVFGGADASDNESDSDDEDASAAATILAKRAARRAEAPASSG